MAFTNEQMERYSRHILLQDVGLEGQEKILNAKVLIIGAGGLGYIAIYYGYNRSSTSVTILATFLILILIFLIQFLGDFLTRKLSHK